MFVLGTEEDGPWERGCERDSEGGFRCAAPSPFAKMRLLPSRPGLPLLSSLLVLGAVSLTFMLLLLWPFLVVTIDRPAVWVC